jgi:hypothetical protein
LSNCGTQELSNCNLTIQTLLESENGQVNHIWIIAQGAVTVYLENVSNKIDEGAKFNVNNVQWNQTLANYIIKSIKDISSTVKTSPRTELCLIIGIFTFTLATFVISITNRYKQWKMNI